jgi:hypothetical protein
MVDRRAGSFAASCGDADGSRTVVMVVVMMMMMVMMATMVAGHGLSPTPCQSRQTVLVGQAPANIALPSRAVRPGDRSGGSVQDNTSGTAGSQCSRAKPFPKRKAIPAKVARFLSTFHSLQRPGRTLARRPDGQLAEVGHRNGPSGYNCRVGHQAIHCSSKPEAPVPLAPAAHRLWCVL